MRIVFMGTPDFAAMSLERLYTDGYDVAGVFTQPDKARKRGMKVSYSPVKETALAHGTPVFQPSSLRETEVHAQLAALRCDLIVVVAYGKLLPCEILSIPPLGCVNIHASLLPKYRGAAPVQWAVLSGEKETGVTAIYMSKELDSGDILLAKRTGIKDEETAAELYDRLSTLGAQLLSETAAAISRGETVRAPQIEAEATYAPSLTKDMSPIDWNKTAFEIQCAVRGLTPWPVATASVGGCVLRVFSVDIEANESDKMPGEVISAGQQGIKIACADAAVVIKELQAPGGRRMHAADYLRGHALLVQNA